MYSSSQDEGMFQFRGGYMQKMVCQANANWTVASTSFREGSKTKELRVLLRGKFLGMQLVLKRKKAQRKGRTKKERAVIGLMPVLCVN